MQRDLLERLGEVLGQEADRDHRGENGRKDDRDRPRGVSYDRTHAEREEREQTEVDPLPTTARNASPSASLTAG